MMKKSSCKCASVCIVEELFGQIASENGATSDEPAAAKVKVKSYKMSNDYGTEVVVMSWGATIVSIKCLDKYGQPGDIVFGFDNLDSYLDPRLSQLMMGCTLGRCVNSAGGTIQSEDSEQELTDGAGASTSGCSFGRRLWEACVEDECRVVMSYASPDGEDGCAGALLATVKFELTRSNGLEIAMRAVASKPTTVNMSHSCIFNLAGHASGPEELRAHEVSFNCDRWAIDELALRRVAGTAMDLRVPRLLGQLIDELADEAPQPHYLAITRGAAAASLQPKMCFASRILHRKSGRFLEVYSDQPGLDFCAGGPLAAALDHDRRRPITGSKGACLNAAACDCDSCSQNSPAASPAASSSSSSSSSKIIVEPALQFLPGKCGAKYVPFGGFSLLPRNRPTLMGKVKSPPQLQFSSAALRPGQVYYHELVYKFGVNHDNYCPS